MSDQDQTAEEELQAEQQVCVHSCLCVVHTLPLNPHQASVNTAITKVFNSSNTRGSSRLEYKFYEQLQRVLGSSASSAVPEVTFDVEEVNDEEQQQDGDDDLQFVGQTSRMDMGVYH